MGSLNPSFIPKLITQFLDQVSGIGSVTQKVLQINDLVNRFESETTKIESFKREIPLCMLLINDAIVMLKEELMVLKNSSNGVQPVLEEFMPIKNNFNHDDDDDAKIEIITNHKDNNGDKKNWLSSTHLWNSNENLNHKSNSLQETIKKKTEEEDSGKVFVKENTILNSCFIPDVRSNSVVTSQSHTFRKQRRRWSSELHKRFVNVLQQLGGSQVATPKQIRELMEVDGLTNDEVKSHLQKYRLRTRRIRLTETNQSCVLVEEDQKSENYSWSGNL